MDADASPSPKAVLALQFKLREGQVGEVGDAGTTQGGGCGCGCHVMHAPGPPTGPAARAVLRRKGDEVLFQWDETVDITVKGKGEFFR